LKERGYVGTHLRKESGAAAGPDHEQENGKPRNTFELSKKRCKEIKRFERNYNRGSSNCWREKQM